MVLRFTSIGLMTGMGRGVTGPVLHDLIKVFGGLERNLTVH